MEAVAPLLLGAGDTILFEIASPVDYTSDNPRIAYHKRRWGLWNVAQAAHLAAHLRPCYPLLVAPSHTWTKGFPLEVRHKMAACKQKQKDLREAEAMLWFYGHTPADWIPLWDFLRLL